MSTVDTAETNKTAIYISNEDHVRLRPLADALPDAKAGGQPSLKAELERAILLPKGELPEGVVTMDSKVRIQDLSTGEEEELFLVWPHRADPAREWISVLSPIGTALIGFRVGNEVTWPTPGGQRNLKIVAVERDAVPADDWNDTNSFIRMLTGR